MPRRSTVTRLAAAFGVEPTELAPWLADDPCRARADALLDQAEEQALSTRDVRQAVNRHRTPIGTPPSSGTCTEGEVHPTST
jgi:hypothetical protein